MTVQINVKMPDKFYNYISKLSEEEGFVSVQEFVRSAVRSYVKEGLSKEELEHIDKIYSKAETNNAWKNKKELLNALDK